MNYLWDDFKDFIFEKLLPGILFTLLVLLILAFSIYIYHSVAFYWQNTKEYSARLESTDFHAGSTQSGTGTVIGADGKVGIGVVTTTTADSYTTVWMIDGIGRIVSGSKNVYMRASEKTKKVIVSEHWGDFKILDVVD